MPPAAKNKKREVPALEETPGKQRARCVGFFRGVAAGKVKKATKEDVVQAKEALETWDGLPTADQTAFAASFFSNKGTKNFGFIKDYTEKARASKEVTQVVDENYFTRIAVLNVKKHMRASLPHPLYINPIFTIPAYDVQT